MIKCINSNIQIYSDGNYNYNNWNLINNKGIFNILNNTSNRVDFCILQSGNIGIGSASPTSKLDIVGDVAIQGRTTITSNLILNNTLSTAPIAQFGTSSTAFNNVYIVGGSSARIGIGTSSPSVPLDVVGRANISGLITANGGLIVPTGQTLNLVDGLSTISVSTTTMNANTLNVLGITNASGGIVVPSSAEIVADGGIRTTSIYASNLILATKGIVVSAGSLLTANGGISATTITTSGLITANNGITIPVGKSVVANGGITTTTLGADTLEVRSTTGTAPIVQYGTNASATKNIYFTGGGNARIGIGSSVPSVSLDVVGSANISGAIAVATIGASGSISANSIVSATTILAGELITANGGVTVPIGKQIVANGGISATSITTSGLVTANAGIQATTINTSGVVNTNGGVISGSTITSYGLVTANAGLLASTITSLGIINADAGISATTITATSAIKGTTLEMSGLIKTNGGIDTTTIVASGQLTASNVILANAGIIANAPIVANKDINSFGVIRANTATAKTPIAQFGTNTIETSNLYFIGGGNARIGIGSSAPTVSLDVVGDANITEALRTGQGIYTTTVDISNILTIKSAIATTPNAQIGNHANATSNLYFIGGGTARIGIGSSSPINALDICGDMNITGIYKKGDRDIILDTSNYIMATSNNIINRLDNYTPFTWIINRQTSNLYYTIGNVGIGTTEPVKKLHIQHPTGELVRIETNASGLNQVSGIEFGIPSYNTTTRSKITSTTYAGNASDLQFSTASAVNASIPRLIITPIGNVGIGSQNPQQILQVGNAGRLRIANTSGDYTVIGTADTDNSTNTKIEISGYSRGGNISYVATNIDGSHRFITKSANERMCITSIGNVGIGTTIPEQLLTLYGSNTVLKIKNSVVSAGSVAINLENGEDSEWVIRNSNNCLAFDYESSNRLIMDGVHGGIGIGTNPHSNYRLNILGDIQIAGDIIPRTNVAYNLGSLANKWND